MDDPPDAEYYCRGEGDIEESAVDVLEYLQAGYLDFTNAGKPKKTSARKMRDFFQINEFYPEWEKTRDLVRTEMLVFLFAEISSSVKGNGIRLIREIVDMLSCKVKNGYNLSDFYFKHIRNNSGMDFQPDYTFRALESLHSAFQLLPPGQ
jgi:hypothetical protein